MKAKARAHTYVEQPEILESSLLPKRELWKMYIYFFPFHEWSNYNSIFDLEK